MTVILAIDTVVPRTTPEKPTNLLQKVFESHLQRPPSMQDLVFPSEVWWGEQRKSGCQVWICRVSCGLVRQANLQLMHEITKEHSRLDDKLRGWVTEMWVDNERRNTASLQIGPLPALNCWKHGNNGAKLTFSSKLIAIVSGHCRATMLQEQKADTENSGAQRMLSKWYNCSNMLGG